MTVFVVVVVDVGTILDVNVGVCSVSVGTYAVHPAIVK